MNASIVVEPLEAQPFRPFVVILPISEAAIYVENPKQARVEEDTLFFQEPAAQGTER